VGDHLTYYRRFQVDETLQVVAYQQNFTACSLWVTSAGSKPVWVAGCWYAAVWDLGIPNSLEVAEKPGNRYIRQ